MLTSLKSLTTNPKTIGFVMGVVTTITVAGIVTSTRKLIQAARTVEVNVAATEPGSEAVVDSVAE